MQNLDLTKDYHVHCGQFYETYYQPAFVVKSLYLNGIKELWLSSTSSAVLWENLEEKNEILKHIEAELTEALEMAKLCDIKLHPLYWVIPKRHCEGEKISDVMKNFPYDGFKIHTKANNWDLSKIIIQNLLSEICEFATENNLPVLIHTGCDEVDNPRRFEYYFSKYQKIKFILAHCKELNTVISLFEKYPNVYGDTAFCPQENINAIAKAGFSNKILFGTDFPITHWYNSYIKKEYPSLQELKENYSKILNDL